MRYKGSPLTIFLLTMASTLQKSLIKIVILEAMQEVQQFEDCFELQLNIPKVTHIFFLSPSRLLLLSTPRKYSIIDIIDRNTTQIVKNGTFPFMLVDQVKPLDRNQLLFVHQNQLHLYDLMQGVTKNVFEIPKSEIYEEQFQFEISQEQDQFLVVFYKTSVLKSTPVTVYYDVNLLSISTKFQKIRKVKVEHQDLRKFGFCCGEIISYQTTGYTIQIVFLQSNISHKINSIFHLFLVEAEIRPQVLILHFTHEDIDNGMTLYEVTKNKIKKLERKERAFEPHLYQNKSGSRSILYKNCFNHRQKDHFSGIFRVKAMKQTKYLKIMEKLLPETIGKQFKQTVLNLLI